MNFENMYENAQLADAYSRLEFPGTYYLAYRDLPAIIATYVKGDRALDFGCGAGRSTRFLRGCGFDVIGVDIAESMLERAREIDPDGDYRLLTGSGLTSIAPSAFDLVLSAFTFDNVPTMERKVELFRALGGVLHRGGTILNLVSTPEIYRHEWASFSTADFPENEHARTGDVVRIINTAIEDRRPVEDILWPDAAYRETYARAGLDVIAVHRPLGRADESQPWVNETTIAPWVIYVLSVGR
jgi:SAM-dependent methyltransferase